MINIKNINKKSGLIIIQTIIFSSIVIMIISALSSYTATTIKAGRIAFHNEQAFQSAEAGIDYYRWHLAHAPSDYKDGTGLSGPYIHSLKDKSGNTIGEFSLSITPPLLGSTKVTINSTGSSILDSTYTREIKSEVAKPSIAKYSVAGNNAFRFGAGTEIFGPIHVNGGVRFDGLAHNLVTSATTIYDDPDHSGSTEIGVHTHVNPPPGSGVNDTYRIAESNPNSIPSRPDVFEAGRLISQPTINFSSFTSDLATLKANAQSIDGFYRDSAGAPFVGYHIFLKTNDTFDLYKINSWASRGTCNYGAELSSWSVGTQTLQGNYPFPANGIIFIEDHVVIDGQINGGRLTITAADLPIPPNPANYKNIIINNDISYTNYDGTDALGLIGQAGVMVGLISEDNLKIDAALIAQNNRVGRFYYSGDATCIYKNRSTITLFGMIASYSRYGFAYTDGTGYTNRNIIYDANLLYAPPPNFPITSDEYQILSWQEIK